MKRILLLLSVLLVTVTLSAKDVTVTVFPTTATITSNGKPILPASDGNYTIKVGVVR